MTPEEKCVELLERLLKVCEVKLEKLECAVEDDKASVINDILGLNAALTQVTKNINKYRELERWQ